ncbi:ATP synthase subunit b [bacterium BMS3Bbin12]|nr:ATP synthase subunit b [bacterium BMS3Abin12]GBE47081.1 ATP synthase subunit b [bacterium BMS3Bbin12]GBE51036.1 ATP synthase subunit b [bacterium BMS3Bbin13]HDK03401.1 F0F1 ATP synthase subunit B [Gammaproteobacteria bacterium]
MVALTGTLLVQIVVFLTLIWFIKAFLWKPLIDMMDDRKKHIADGIAAAEQGRKELERAETRVEQAIEEARQRANEIVDNSNRRAREIVAVARNEAETERGRELERAREEIDQMVRQAREALRGDFARISVAAAGRILGRELDPKAHASLVDEFAEELF